MDEAIREMHKRDLGERTISVNKAQPKMSKDLDHGYKGSYASSRRGRYAGGDSSVAHDECFNCGCFRNWARDCPPDGGCRGGSGAMFSSRSRYRGTAIDDHGDRFRDRDRYIDDRYDGRRFGDRDRFDRRDYKIGSRDSSIRDRPEGMSPSQRRNYGNVNLPLVEASTAQLAEDVVHAGTTKGCSGNKPGEEVRIRRIDFNNWWKKGHTNVRNGYRSGCFTLFIENLPEKIHWKRLGSLFCNHGHVINVFIPNKRNSIGVFFGFIRFATIEEARKAISKMNGSHIYGSKINISLAKYNPRQSYWRKSSIVVQHKFGMEVVSRIKHCKVKGVVDEDKLHMLSNCLVGWCKNFTKIDSASLRVVKNEKLETLANWFSGVETWSESLVVECRRVCCEFPSSFDRAKIQILIKSQVRIDESLELKVDTNSFKIMVHEIDPSFKLNSWVPEVCDDSLELVPSIGS
ncbi:hypothetical protein F3Y22_tig00110303pilonHSYRG00212 [Hibiscus syriacus]|uniref:RRM domain-containing protein n=1 Tax=Hibiscus syriacus TaxID=106335 RepID=A0A6A3B756_HIBSY|nr:hypothetical protein F3Y22_tig00110303pilonHSYRG00212 [Hibiscus syriacus]